MSQRRVNPTRLPVGGDPVGLSMLKEMPTLIMIECKQWIACVTATLTMFVVGSIDGWTTTSLLHLTSGSDDLPLTLTHDEYSWILSLTVFSSMIGSLAGAQLADQKGRKHCLLVCSIMFMVGWLIIYITTSVRMLYIARIIHGIAVGIAHTINPMYVSEVADIRIRGAVGSLITVNVFSGSLLTCWLGSYMSYNTLLVVLLIVSFLSFLWNTYFPETPYYLMVKGRKKAACKSIACYKGIVDPIEMQIELRDLRVQARYELYPKSRYELHLQSKYELRQQSKGDSALESRTNVPSQSRTDLPPESRSDLPSQSRTDLPSQSRTDLPSQSRADLPSQSRSNFTLSSTSYFASQSTSDVASQTKSDLPSHATSNIPPQSTREQLSDGAWEVVDTEVTSDLPSSSDSPSISVIHSEVVCDVHPQPTEELRRPATRAPLALPRQTLRPSHSQSTSEIQPSTSETNADLICELQSQSRSNSHTPSSNDLHTQPKLDSRESITDTDDTDTSESNHICLTKLQVILQRINRKALFIMLGLITAQKLSGNMITTQNLEILFTKTTMDVELHVATILILAASLIAGSLTIVTVDTIGRRTLLILSTLGSCFTLTILATYLLIMQQNLDDPSIIPTFPIIDLITYLVIFQFGLGTLPNVLLCELFPTELRGCASAIIVIFDNIINFIVSKLYQVINDNVSSYSIYYIFATSGSLAFLMVFIYIPETKGKTYPEIEALLVAKNFE